MIHLTALKHICSWNLIRHPITIKALEKDILSESTSVSGSRVALAASFDTGNIGE